MNESEPALDPKMQRRWIAGICAFTGFWGILTGFAVFILIRTGDFSNPLTFVVGLCVAAAASFVVEALRESVRGEITVRPTRRVGSIVGTIVTLIVFELFILAVHNAADIFGDDATVEALRDALLGPVARTSASAPIDLIVLAVIWLVTGTIVGLALGLLIVREPGDQPLRERIVRGGATGVVAAIVAAPVLVFVYVLLWRLGLAVQLAFTDQTTLAAHYASIMLRVGEMHVDGPATIVPYAGIFVVFGFLKLWLWSTAGKIAVVALIATLVIVGRRFGEWRPLGIVLAGCAAGVVAPLFADIGDVVRLALLAAVVWFVPGLVLGLAAPLLEEPSDRARFWSAIATLLGAIVAVLTIVRWHDLASRDALFVTLAIAFFGSALLFTRFRDLREFWPALALCLATIAASLTFLLVSLTASFQGVLAEVASIDSLPASIEPANDVRKLDADVAGVAIAWHASARGESPTDDPSALADAFRNVDTLSRADRDALIEAQRGALLALRTHAEAQLVAVAQRAGSPVSLTAAGANDDATVIRFRDAFERREDAMSDADLARYRASTSERVRKQISDDDLQREHDAVDVRIAVDRVLTTGAVLADVAAIEAEDATTEQHAADERRFSASAVPEQLEGCLAGSFAFWVTVGLLSGWAIRREQNATEAA